MAGRYKDSSEFMTWYHNLGEDEKKKFNHRRYERAKERREMLGEVKKPEVNKDLYMCQALWKRARLVPWALVDNTAKPEALLEWYNQHKDKPCKYCGSPATSIDHIIPLSKDGKHTIKNLQVICWQCNRAKNGDMPEVFEGWLEKIVANFRQNQGT